MILAGFAHEEDGAGRKRVATAAWAIGQPGRYGAALRSTGCGSQPAGPCAVQAPALELQVFLQEHS